MIEVETDGMAHGGEAVGRIDGKAVFVAGAMPGEVVRGTVTRDRGSWARLELTEVVSPSPLRIEPPCPHFAACGGCQWQFAPHDAQLEWKRSIVAGQLAHLGGVADPPVRATVSAAGPYGYRNRLDLLVENGVPGFRRGRSHDHTPITSCLIGHPLLGELVDAVAGMGDGTVTLRVGTRTGERLVIIDTDIAPELPEGVRLARRSRGGVMDLVGPPRIHEEVSGSRFRITGTNFFQVNTEGADALVELVGAALEPGPDDVLLDAYAGGGLFSATVGRSAGHVISVESHEGAVRDLAENAPQAELAPVRVENVEGGMWDLVVADPPRSGLGARAAEVITAPRPRSIALVSCDPAALARDTRLLTGFGYTLRSVTPVDLFPQTFHIEAVAHFSTEPA